MARKKLPFWMSFGILIVYPTVGAVLAYQFIPFWTKLRGLSFEQVAPPAPLPDRDDNNNNKRDF